MTVRIVFAAALLLTTPAAADLAISTGVGVDNLDGVGGRIALDWTAGDHRLGARVVGSALRERFVGGYAVDDGLGLEARLTYDLTLRRADAVRFDLGFDVGARQIRAATATPAGDTSLAVLGAVRPGVRALVAPAVMVHLGTRLELAQALDPEGELDTLATPIEAGVRWWFTDAWALDVELGAGSAFGYGGDGMKHTLRGAIGLAWAPRPAPTEADAGDLELFAGLEWRGLALAGHASHGPGFSFGIGLLDGWLKLGLAGFGRPGPLNPETFAVTAADGQTYKGQETLELRSDGSLIGLLVALHIPVSERWAIEVPLTAGQGGFGFYLTGDDRETPDGRRVSAWENELLDGRDAGFGLAIDAGVRAMYVPATTPWLRPHVGVAYTTIVGYDAYVRGDYDGPSVAVGIEVGLR